MKTLHAPEDAQYLAARIAEAIATDARTNMLDVDVRAAADAIVVSGVVSCAARRKAVAEVINELLPLHMKLDNRLCIQKFQEPAESESVE